MSPDAGGQKRRPPIWIPKRRRLWGCYPNPPREQHSVIVTEEKHLFMAYSRVTIFMRFQAGNQGRARY